MKKLCIFIATMLLLWGLVGCTTSEQSPQKQEEPKPSSERPATKQDTILLEGMEEEFTFYLVEDQALGFSTYVIEDMVAEQKNSTDAGALFVYANFGGVKNQQAAIRVFSPKQEAQVDIDELIKLMKAEFTDIWLQISETSLASNHPFMAPGSAVEVKEVIALSSADLVGRAIFFDHDDRAYVLFYHYPPEYGDGFEPRAHKFIEDIVWYN